MPGRKLRSKGRKASRGKQGSFSQASKPPPSPKMAAPKLTWEGSSGMKVAGIVRGHTASANRYIERKSVRVDKNSWLVAIGPRCCCFQCYCISVCVVFDAVSIVGTLVAHTVDIVLDFFVAYKRARRCPSCSRASTCRRTCPPASSST